MTLTLSQSATATAVNLTVGFLGVGGTGPYTYAVLSGGAGGTINASTGVYTAPAAISSASPAQLYDTVQVTDSTTPTPLTATAQVLVGTPLLLVCDILQNQLALDSNHIYLWEQKIFEPTDHGLYVAVSVPSCRPFGNVNYYQSGSGLTSCQYVAMSARLDFDIISRGPDARDRKEQVLLALYSTYSLQQQDACSFSLGRLPPGVGFINLSGIDGAAIPYRYKISCNMTYAVQQQTAADYFNSFSTVQTNVNQ